MLIIRGILRHQRAVVHAMSVRSFITPHASKERLLSEYNRAYGFAYEKSLPEDVNKKGIFANDELNLSEIDVYGYDYDYTLAAYKKTTVEKMIHSLAKQALVNDMQYPEELLQFGYDPDLTIRGLHYDIVNGLLIKVNSALQIQPDAVFRGRKQLKDHEVAKIFPANRLTLDQLEPKSPLVPTRFVHLVDHFAKPVMCLLADVIQWFVDNNIDYEPESIYTDVRACIDKAHPMFHLAAASEPCTFLEIDPKLRPMLKALKSRGKTTFLMTNSPFEIVNAGMNHMLGEDWGNLFDIVIVSAKKPSFFSAKQRHFRVYSPRTGRLKWQRVVNLERGNIYSGGNYENLQKMTGWSPNRVLYFGDHPYADLQDLSMYHGWRTCAIIEELEEEIDKLNNPEVKRKVSWNNILQQLLDTYQDCIVSEPECREILQDWRHELHDTRTALKNEFNPNFGSVFRSRRKPTFFSRRLFRVADVYTSRVTNFSLFPMNHTFFPRRGVLPHEFKSWFV